MSIAWLRDFFIIFWAVLATGISVALLILTLRLSRKANQGLDKTNRTLDSARYIAERTAQIFATASTAATPVLTIASIVEAIRRIKGKPEKGERKK